MKLKGKCDCSEKVICDCGTLSFSSYVSPSDSLLNVGNLIASNCILDEYVIDWYVDGIKMLVTGKGTDPDIQTLHPFTGDAAIPVVGGLWIPVVRYITVAGQDIYTTNIKCRKWCDMIISLPQITVNSIYCGFKGTGVNLPSVYYDFKIKYRYTQDWSLASRTIRYDLNSSSIHFAYFFTAYNVADRIKIFHSNDLNNPLTDVIVGNTGVVKQTTTMPYGVKSSSYKQIIALPEYTAGSYLIIQILPSVISGGIATDWDLEMKCLDSGYVIEYDFVSQACWQWDTDSFDFFYDTAACIFKCRIKIGCSQNQNFSLNVTKYGGMTFAEYYALSGDIFILDIASTTNIGSGTYQKTGYSTKTATYGDYSLKKEGDVYTFTCANVLDYNDIKSGFDYLMASAWVSGFINDSTKKEYYRYYRFYHYNSPLFCGQDGETTWVLYFHLSSVVTFDPVNLIVTITCAQITCDYPVSPDPCNRIKSSICSLVANLESTRTRADFNHPTKCRYKYPLGGGWYFSSISLPNIYDFNGPSFNFANNKCLPLPMTDPAWHVGVTYYQFYVSSFRINITAERNSTTGEWITDPLENFTLYWMINPNTGTLLNGTIYKIWEKVNNVETVRLTWEDFINGLP